MNAIIETATPELEAEAASVDTMVAWAEQLAVATTDDYEKAGEGLRRIKARAKELDEKRKELTQPLDALKKKWMDWFRTPLAKLEQAETAVKRNMVAFQEEQDRIRREAERQAAEAARRERERMDREAAALAEKARKDAEAAERRAAAMEAEGKAERAEALRAAAAEKEQARAADVAALQMASAAMPVAPVVDIPRAASAGISTREDWDFEIIDEAAIPREYMTVNDKAIRGVVKALKDKAAIPGIRVFSKKNIAARSA